MFIALEKHTEENNLMKKVKVIDCLMYFKPPRRKEI